MRFCRSRGLRARSPGSYWHFLLPPIIVRWASLVIMLSALTKTFTVLVSLKGLRNLSFYFWACQLEVIIWSRRPEYPWLLLNSTISTKPGQCSQIFLHRFLDYDFLLASGLLILFGILEKAWRGLNRVPSFVGSSRLSPAQLWFASSSFVHKAIPVPRIHQASKLQNS